MVLQFSITFPIENIEMPRVGYTLCVGKLQIIKWFVLSISHQHSSCKTSEAPDSWSLVYS